MMYACNVTQVKPRFNEQAQNDQLDAIILSPCANWQPLVVSNKDAAYSSRQGVKCSRNAQYFQLQEQ